MAYYTTCNSALWSTVLHSTRQQDTSDGVVKSLQSQDSRLQYRAVHTPPNCPRTHPSNQAQNIRHSLEHPQKALPTPASPSPLQQDPDLSFHQPCERSNNNNNTSTSSSTQDLAQGSFSACLTPAMASPWLLHRSEKLPRSRSSATIKGLVGKAEAFVGVWPRLASTKRYSMFSAVAYPGT